MPNYEYAIYTYGGLRKGVMDAPDERELRARLRDQGMFPVKIKKQQAHEKIQLNDIFRERVKLKDLVVFSQQLSTMVEAEFPITKALTVIAGQCTNATLKDTLNKIKADIEAGETLGVAMEKYPKVFPLFFTTTVRAAEDAGTMEFALKRLADYYDAQAELRGKVISIITYPAIVFLLVTGVVTAMLVFVVPIFTKVYEQFNAELPQATQNLIAVSKFVTNQGYLIVLGFIGFIYGMRWLHKHEKTGRIIDKIVLKLPMAGKAVQLTTLSRLIRTLSSSFAAGMTITAALDTTMKVIKNRLFHSLLEDCKKTILGGGTLSAEIRNSPLFPPMAIQMMTVGEESGNLSKMLDKAAMMIERDLDNLIKRIVTAIEPLLTVVLGTAVLAISVAMYLPMISITQQMRH